VVVALVITPLVEKRLVEVALDIEELVPYSEVAVSPVPEAVVKVV
jgi:hypothetical protein